MARNIFKNKYSYHRIISCDGGAFLTKDFKFYDAYFSVLDEETGEVLHREEKIGDFYSGLAEYLAIEWAVDNLQKPITIYSDCTTAIAWAKGRGSDEAKRRYNIHPLSLWGVDLIYQHGTKADVYNAKHIHYKYIPRVSKSADFVKMISE
jgi:uncharacterized protein (UPF0128 family)